MITLSHTVAEAFQRGAHIAKESDVDDRFLTVDKSVWKLTSSEWVELRQVVRGLSVFLASTCGQGPRQPIPSRESVWTLKHWGHGVRFWFPAEGHNAEEMTYRTLEYCVRDMWEYGFSDGDTIRDASSHSSGELWSDVILPAIERGEIEVTIWGEPLR